MSVSHRLLRHGQSPVVIAHRGASARAPENTMPAFLAAFEDGALWIETDVQPTADNRLVLLHDDDVDRTTTGSGPIRALSANQVAQLDAGRWFGPSWRGVSVPALTDLLTLIADDRRLLLEIKGDHTTTQLAILLDTLERTEVGERVLLQSFEVPVLERLRALRPDEPVGLLVEEIDHDPVARCRSLGAVAYNPDVTQLLIQPEIVADLHAADVAVMPWTVDDHHQWAAATAYGVDGIITNRPAELLAWQAVHPQERRPQDTRHDGSAERHRTP